MKKTKCRCEFCGKEMGGRIQGIQKHIKNNHKIEAEKIPNLYMYSAKILYPITNTIMSKIVKKYKTGESINKLSSIFNLPYNVVKNILDYCNVEIRNTSSAAKQEIVRERYKKTVNERYGVENVSQASEIQNKKRETFKRNYGVDNIFKTEGFYNNWWNKMSEKEKEEICRKKTAGLGCKSTLEKKIQIALNTIGVEYTSQFYLKKKRYDFKIGNIIIETNGDYWHASPKKYKKDDIIKYPNNVFKKASDVWKKDIKKKRLAEKNGYTVVYIWEDELNKMTEQETIEWTLKTLKSNQ